MSARPWLSGFCNPSAPLDSHERCQRHPRRDGKPCSCTRRDCPCAPKTEPELTGRRVTDCAVEVLEPAGYLSPEWHEARRTTVSASEIAAVLGLSPWASPFDLWWLKRTGEDSKDESKRMRRGRRIEALIIEDFRDAHPELTVTSGGLCVNTERPWQACTPDGLAYEYSGSDVHGEQWDPIAVIEAKSDGDREAWGEDGTDEIPVRYRCQVLWQMDTLGLSVAYVPAWVGGDTYREFVVEYDSTDVQVMRDAAEAFLASVREDRPPEVDAHVATTRRLKRLHPTLTDEQVEIPLTILRQHQAAKRLKKAAEERMRLAENRIRHIGGNAASLAVTDENGKTKTFSHTRSDVKERTQVVRAHTRDSINFPRKDV